MAERMRKEAFGEAGSWFPGSSAVTTCREFDLSLTGGYDGKKRVEETLGHVKLYEL